MIGLNGNKVIVLKPFERGDSMKEFLRKLFCKHDMEKIDWRFAETESTVYSRRLYKCSKCGKEKWVDGRYDPYF